MRAPRHEAPRKAAQRQGDDLRMIPQARRPVAALGARSPPSLFGYRIGCALDLQS